MENLFQMLANAADGAFIINKNQQIIYWNQAAQKILGYAPNKVVGRPCYEILRGCNDKGQAVCRHHCRVQMAALAGRSVSAYDLVTRTRSGVPCWINITILTSPTGSDSGDSLIIHLFRDATQAKQNEQLVQQMFSTSTKPPLDDPPPAPPPKKPRLTKREREVLALLAQGCTTVEISELLSITTATVRNHVQNLLHSLQVHSRLEAVVYAMEHGLVE